MSVISYGEVIINSRNEYTWPITVSGNGTIVTLGADLESDDSTVIQFIISDAGAHVTINGNNHVVNVTATAVGSYTGLVQSASNNTKVQNVGVTAAPGIALAYSAGWVGCQSFRGTVEYCYSTGTIGGYAGGICGNAAGQNAGGSCVVTSCYSTGTIGGYAGGICGNAAGQLGGSCVVTSCYSTGDIGESAGGICGYGAGQGGSCVVTSCYSTGTIGNYAGGICGAGAGNSGTCSITWCYSTGTIGNYAGGICGAEGSCSVSSCYSTGSIENGAGGICGAFAGYSGGSCAVTSCYSTGDIGQDGGGICGCYAGERGGTCRIQYCYFLGSTNSADLLGTDGVLTNDSTPNNPATTVREWSDTTASILTGLSGINNNFIKVITDKDKPWKLASFLTGRQITFVTANAVTYSSGPFFPLSDRATATSIQMYDYGTNTAIGAAENVSLASTTVTFSYTLPSNAAATIALRLLNGATVVDKASYGFEAAPTAYYNIIIIFDVSVVIFRGRFSVKNNDVIEIYEESALYENLVLPTNTVNGADNKFIGSNFTNNGLNFSSSAIDSILTNLTGPEFCILYNGINYGIICKNSQIVDAINVNVMISQASAPADTTTTTTEATTTTTEATTTTTTAAPATTTTTAAPATTTTTAAPATTTTEATTTTTAASTTTTTKPATTTTTAAANTTTTTTTAAATTTLTTTTTTIPPTRTFTYKYDANFNTVRGDIPAFVNENRTALQNQGVSNTAALNFTVYEGSIIVVVSGPAETIGQVQNVVAQGALYVTVGGTLLQASVYVPPDNIFICFKEGTRILTSTGYVPVEHLAKGQLIQTFRHGLVPLRAVGRSRVSNVGGRAPRSKNRLYVYRRGTVESGTRPFADLVVTGEHSALVPSLQHVEKKMMTKHFGSAKTTDDQFHLLAQHDARAVPYEPKGVFTVYHFALECGRDYERHFGVYANGMLMESCSVNHLRAITVKCLF